MGAATQQTGYGRIELAEALTDEEKEVFAELRAAKLLSLPGRRAEGHTPEIARKVSVLKGLVYRDLITFSIGEPHHYVFIDREAVGRI